MIERWGDFVKRVTLPAGIDHIASSGRYTQGRNLRAVCALAASVNPEKVCEVGTALGHTTVALALSCPDARVYTFDICKALVQKITPYYNEVPTREEHASFLKAQDDEIKSRVLSILASPDRIHERLSELGPFDFAYIDGDHTWRSVVGDTKVLLGWVRLEGILCWDDYTTSNEIRAFIDVLNNRVGNLITWIEGTRVCYVKLTEEAIGDLRHAARDL